MSDPAHPLAGRGDETVRVRPLGARDDIDRWTAFTAAHAEATLYHSIAWRDVVQRVFGHTPCYMLAERGEAVVGVLPMFEIRLPLLGAKLISMPYDVGSGGALANDEAAEGALGDAATRLARDRDVGWLECRTGVARPALEMRGFVRSEPVIQSDLRFEPGQDPWRAVSADHRQSVRRAARRGVTVREAETMADYDAYYGVYLRAFRDFGTPPYGRSYFPALFELLRPTAGVRVLLAEAEGRCVGGMLLFCHGATWINKIAAVLPEAVPLRAFAALYGHALDLAAREGVRRLSLGTSSRAQSGLVDFKARWGAVSQPAVIYQLPVRARPRSLERYYEEEGLGQRAWRHLPVAVTPPLGHFLNRWFC